MCVIMSIILTHVQHFRSIFAPLFQSSHGLPSGFVGLRKASQTRAWAVSFGSSKPETTQALKRVTESKKRTGTTTTSKTAVPQRVKLVVSSIFALDNDGSCHPNTAVSFSP
jgi:hypothetical protein